MTHPFHPLIGREFALVTYRHNWGEDRVYFYDERGNLSALPASWTSVAPKDPFREMAAGRCLLRFVDLMELVALARQIGERDDGANDGAGRSVSEIMPQVSTRLCRRLKKSPKRQQRMISQKTQSSTDVGEMKGAQ